MPRKSVQQQPESAHCSLCRIGFGIPEDTRYHDRIHDRFLAADWHFGDALDLETRGERDLEGVRLMYDGPTLEERVRGAVMMLECWYTKSLRDAVFNDRSWQRHPDFELWAQLLQIQRFDHFRGDGVQVELLRRFPPRAWGARVGYLYNPTGYRWSPHPWSA